MSDSIAALQLVDGRLGVCKRLTGYEAISLLYHIRSCFCNLDAKIPFFIGKTKNIWFFAHLFVPLHP